jgi:methionyl-tRNA formyltransferase
MGTPEFAVASLEALLESHYNVVAVVTTPDKPAGRGQKLQESDVKKFAVAHNLPVLQPDKLKDPVFIETLKSFKADIQIVVAFRMLPEIIWNMPPLGTFNLHASLLPQYRGAAPINWAIINGEEKSGVTTFFITHEIDTGKIIYQEEVPILPNENAGHLHDKLMILGANLILKTVRSIEEGTFPKIDQSQFIQSAGLLKAAPKIFKDDCRVDWNKPANEVHNFIRGLCPYPACWTMLESPDDTPVMIKLFDASYDIPDNKMVPGSILTNNRSFLKIATLDGFINVHTLQLAGRKKLAIEDFLRGFQFKESSRFK